LSDKYLVPLPLVIILSILVLSEGRIIPAVLSVAGLNVNRIESGLT
jgi:hypothetical protein